MFITSSNCPYFVVGVGWSYVVGTFGGGTFLLYLGRLVTERYVDAMHSLDSQKGVSSGIQIVWRKLPNPPVMALATFRGSVKRNGTLMKDARHRQTYKVRTSYWDRSR